MLRGIVFVNCGTVSVLLFYCYNSTTQPATRIELKNGIKKKFAINKKKGMILLLFYFTNNAARVHRGYLLYWKVYSIKHNRFSVHIKRTRRMEEIKNTSVIYIYKKNWNQIVEIEIPFKPQ